MTGPTVMLRGAEIRAGERVDVLLSNGLVAATGADLPPLDAEVLDVAGCALVPGLHDHHCHLLATAAARESVRCGPPDVVDAGGLASALRRAQPQNGWVRGVDYDESVSGSLDRHSLDSARSDAPVRVQHRGGSLWVLNSAGIAALGLTERWDGEPAGVERDADGRPTGRLWRCDEWLRSRLGPRPVPDLATLSAELAAFGVTGVTDATPELDRESVSLLRSPSLRQRVTLLGDGSGPAPWKIVVSDHALPGPAELAAMFAAVRPRPVAVHCVTRAALVLTLVAMQEVGTVPGDRIEHAAVVPPELLPALVQLGVTVVTQPSLPALRGDRYLEDVDPADRDFLWPYASLVAAGVPVACSSDAPYGSPDPWFAVSAAVRRTTRSGQPIGPAERVSAQQALRGWQSDPLTPGGPTRTVRAGVVADLVVLDAPLEAVLADPDARRVQLTIIGGEVVHRG